ncbi:MFS transporter [Enterococcus faecalis]|uniref:MFS transporter n=2 Tax=Enterococcus faecalis TaxID=1351 RepID=UPI002737E89F|nr:MFS transporter [Enterococcus faecalis]
MFMSKKKFYFYVLSDALSYFGNIVFYLALVAYSSSVSNAGYAISLITTLEFLPEIFSFLLGNVADKSSDKIRTLQKTNYYRAAIYFFIAIAFLYLSDWKLLILVIFLNFLSDIIGCLSDQLYSIGLLDIVPENKFEVYYGTTMSVTQIVSILGKASGGIILTLLGSNYFFMGLLNCLIFLFASLILSFTKKKIINPKEFEDFTDENSKEISFKAKVSNVFSNKRIIKMTKVMLVSNFTLAPLIPIAYISFASGVNKISFPIIISIISTVDSAAVILGFMTGSKVLKKINFYNGMLISAILSIGLLLSIYVKWLGFTVVLLFICSYITAGMYPRFKSIIVDNFDKKELGTANGVINSLLTVSIPISISVFSVLFNISDTFSVIILIFVTTALIIYILYYKVTKSGEYE